MSIYLTGVLLMLLIIVIAAVFKIVVNYLRGEETDVFLCDVVASILFIALSWLGALVLVCVIIISIIMIRLDDGSPLFTIRLKRKN